MPARKRGEGIELDIGKNATIKEILAAAKKVMTPDQYGDFSRKPKKNGAARLVRVRKGATQKEILDAARKDFTAWDLQKFTRDEPTVPAEAALVELEELHQRVTAALGSPSKPRRKKATG
jgi:hypothetical protein